MATWSCFQNGINPIDSQAKMPNFRGEINTFTAWYKNGFGLFSQFHSLWLLGKA